LEREGRGRVRRRLRSAIAAAMASRAQGRAVAALDLPESEFTYVAGKQDRPWSQFAQRWSAIQPRLAAALRAVGEDRPLRVVDLGSCTGFFALNAAHQHPEADVVGVEGSVGIGNGNVGMDQGSAQQILKTSAAQTHLRWIRRLGLKNCFIAPEVWDYLRVCDLASHGRPICDVMFSLSVIHHVHGASLKQYAPSGLSHLDGLIDLMGKLLLLAPCHFIELPNRPWIEEAHDHYGSQRAILEAAARASGREWQFTGPLSVAQWFGTRELWLLEVRVPLPPLDIERCPFPLLYQDPGVVGQGAGGAGASDLEDAASLFSDFTKGPAANCLALDVGGRTIDPGLMLLTEPCHPVDQGVGALLSSAPTELLVAHLALREAVAEAEDALQEAREAELLPEDVGGARRSTAAAESVGWRRLGARESALV
ncbi:unnamed protein product, partial [Prorocentrum cordatum]